MVSCTDTAADLISSLRTRAGLDARAGLQFRIDPARRSLAMHLASGPDPEDDVLDHRGARVFVGPGAGNRLRGQTLDAYINGRTERFFLA